MRGYITSASAIVLLIFSFACSAMQDQGDEQKKTMRDKPKHHTIAGFQNYPPEETAAPKGVLFYLRRVWGSVFLPDVPDGHALSGSETLRLLNSFEGDRITWLGHASFLIRISGTTILTDPFLTEFASPVSWAGPRRFVPPGIPLGQLPDIDLVVVSHNHYDHLDDKTVRRLKDKEKIHIIVPLGIESFFTERGYHKISSLDWGERVSIDDITLIALPSVHDSGRRTDDGNKTLWASWAIVGPAMKVLFIGDTGYSETIFREIGAAYGPFDYVILPIGGYEPRKLMWMSHITPEEAVAVGNEVLAKTFIASHWGTLKLSDEPPWEPPKRFLEAGLNNGISEERLWTMKIGETRPLSLF